MEQDFTTQFNQAIDDYATGNMFGVSKIPAHAHNGIDSFKVDYTSIDNQEKFVMCRIVTSATNTAVATGVGGDFVMPFNGYVVSAGATVDTAGTTGDTTIDILKNGTSIMITKVTINSGSKTSRTATVQSLTNPTYQDFVIGDIFTFNIDGISTTAAKGCTVFLNTIQV